MSWASATTPSSSMIRTSSAIAFSARSRTCSAVDGWSPCVHSSATSGSTDGVPVASQVQTPFLPAFTNLSRFSLTVKRSGNEPCSVSPTCSAMAGPTSCIRFSGDIGRPSGSSAESATSNGVPSSTATSTSPRKRSSSRFTTNAVASFTSTLDFFSCLPTENAVASAASSVFSPRTISKSGSTATGLKKWKPTTRSGCCSFDAIAVIDSDEVFVARIASGETCCSSSANTCCFTPSSSKTASITKSASANAALSSEPVTSALSRFAPSGDTRFLASSLSISSWT